MAENSEVQYRRVEVGFSAGQLLVVRVSQEELERLEAAVTRDGGDGWLEIEVDDGKASLKVSDITYIRSDQEDSRIGFGGS